MSYNLLLVGCGNMGGALLGGWQDAGLIKQAVVVEPNISTLTRPAYQPVDLSHKGEVFPVASPTEIPPAFAPDMIVLSVKPQALIEVLPAYKRYAGRAPFLSIAAGKTLAFFAAHLGSGAAVIRAMPNLPATARKGATVCCANNTASEEQRGLATTLLEAVGTVAWAEENRLDAVTALSGSGPAYVFALVEAMEQAGAALGLDPALAARLARQTVIGAAEILDKSRDDPATWRARVTSKGGTTEAAVKILMENDALLSIMRRAMSAAADRSRQLAQ